MFKDKDTLARTAYEAYVHATGGVSAITGTRLPSFDDQREDIRDAWRAAAEAVALKARSCDLL